jgi:uncharacterized protein (TIGR02246 family)
MRVDELAIRQLVASWTEATRAGDLERILALMAPDVVFLVEGQAPMSGRDAFAASLRTMLLTHRIEPVSRIEELDVAGDLAYCWTRLSVTVTPKDRAGGASAPVKRSGNALSIFRKDDDGRWLLTRDANMLGPAS